MARNYRREYDSYHSSAKQKKNRAGRNAARNSLLADGRVNKGDRRDVHHRDGDPTNNSSSNLVVTSRKTNRSRNMAGGGMAEDKNWIQKAIKKPGSLRKKAGVKKGEDISKSELNKLSKSRNSTTRRQANLAKTLKKMDKGGRTGKTQQRKAPDVAGMTVIGKSTPRLMSGLPPKTTTTTVQADVATPKAEGGKPRGSGVAIQGTRPARHV